MMLRKRNLAASLPLRVFAMAVGAGLAGQACAEGAPSGFSSSGLGSGSGGGNACNIASLALANAGGSACSKNSLGGHAFDSSCTGNAGQPEYWCSDFVRWAWAASGADVDGLTAAAGSFYTYGQKNKTLSDTPSVGDAVVFNYKGGGTADHVAIVTQVNADGTIETMSGDWGGETGSEARFSSTSHVVLNSPPYAHTVGTAPGIIGMTISAYIAPKGMTPCSSTGGAAAGGGSAGSAGSGSGAGVPGGDTSSKPGAPPGGGSPGGSSSGGGSAGSGTGSGGGGSGSGKGSGGKGGQGGSKGSGYAFLEPQAAPRHHTVDLAAGASETIAFSWHDAAGLAAPADLWVEASGRPVLQVASVAGQPFVRAGLDVAPIVPDASYRLVLTRDAAALVVTLLGPSGHEVIAARVAGGRSADVALAPSAWGSPIVADGFEE